MALSVLDVVLPKGKTRAGGVAEDPTYNASNNKQVLSVPAYREHMTDIFESRSSGDSRALLQNLFKHDPDVSASVNAYLTVASSADPWWAVYDQTGKIDPAGTDQVDTLIQAIFGKNDYSLGFQLKPNMMAYFNELRYMLLLRGGIASELIMDKAMMPSELRHVDLATVQWYEAKPGELKPVQKPNGSDKEIKLDIPSFVVAFYKRDPTNIYPYSPFVSAINTIAARQQVVNDLYRIMRKTGYPRMQVEVVEEVLRKAAPAEAQQSAEVMNSWMSTQLGAIASTVSNLTVDQVFVHTDSVTPSMFNDKNPGVAVDIQPMIDMFNSQNQAALKTMATIIGRGNGAGVNTASVEARLFAMHADALNDPIAQLMSEVLTLALRLTGSTSRVEFGFDNVELRPALELEPHKSMQQNRLLMLLSKGLISDDDFHMELFNRRRPDDAPILSGTDFMAPAPTGALDGTTTADPAGDAKEQGNSLDRAASSPGASAATGSDSTRKAA